VSDYTPNPWILDDTQANHYWMNAMMDGMPTECLTSCAKEIESLRAELAKRTEERDEARRMYSDLLESYQYKNRIKIADEGAWDLSALDGKPIVMENVQEHIKALRAERDNARRELCYTMCNQPLYSYKGQTPIEIAYYQGWDCFKEKSQDALDRLSQLDEELGLQ
jgi:hypothetical protein